MDSGGFKKLQDDAFKALVDTTRTSGQLANEDLAFHRSVDPAISAALDRRNESLLALARELTRSATAGTSLSQPKLRDAESIDDEWKKIVDVLDNLLENADASLDEYSGVIKKPTRNQEESARQAQASSSKRSSGHIHGQAVGKPQLLFAKPPANHELGSFKPLLKSKPHAIISFEESLSVPREDQQFQHPYEQEIISYKTPAHVFKQEEAIPYQPLETTSAIFVDTLDGVHAMLKELKEAREIAVDLEHHDEHSYIGIVSLMQISTRDKDWVVDTLKPWRQELQILNEVFTDPKILKVLQGSTMDIIWLQRDLGLYIVGLFDTYHASWALGYPRHGLAYLLKKFVDFDAAKQYQRADWRLRPLPTEMFNYARSDTHFLLYVYDMMRNELIDRSEATGQSLIEDVIENSKQECLQRYERPIYDAENGSGQMGWYNMLYKSPSIFDREQFAVFRALHQWRDQVARDEDEGAFSIFKNKALFDIARALPKDQGSLIAHCHPISKFMQKRKSEVMRVIKEARSTSQEQPEMKDFFQPAPRKARNEDQYLESNYKTGPPGHGQLRQPLQITTAQSRFWGNTLNQVRPTTNIRSEQEIEKLRLVLPLPPLDAEIFEDRSRPKPQQQTEEKVTQNRTNSVSRNKDEVVVIRDSGSQKRKLEDETNLAIWNGKSAPSLDKANEVDQDPEAEAAKHLKKQERRKRKEMKRLARGETAQVDSKGHEQDQVPLDYENTPSVLHASGKADRNKTANKPLKPYSKSMNAPKGLGRSQKEIAGKSMTFGR